MSTPWPRKNGDMGASNATGRTNDYFHNGAADSVRPNLPAAAASGNQRYASFVEKPAQVADDEVQCIAETPPQQQRNVFDHFSRRESEEMNKVKEPPLAPQQSFSMTRASPQAHSLTASGAGSSQFPGYPQDRQLQSAAVSAGLQRSASGGGASLVAQARQLAPATAGRTITINLVKPGAGAPYQAPAFLKGDGGALHLLVPVHQDHRNEIHKTVLRSFAKRRNGWHCSNLNPKLPFEQGRAGAVNANVSRGIGYDEPADSKPLERTCRNHREAEGNTLLQQQMIWQNQLAQAGDWQSRFDFLCQAYSERDKQAKEKSKRNRRGIRPGEFVRTESRPFFGRTRFGLRRNVVKPVLRNTRRGLGGQAQEVVSVASSDSSSQDAVEVEIIGTGTSTMRSLFPDTSPTIFASATSSSTTTAEKSGIRAKLSTKSRDTAAAKDKSMSTALASSSATATSSTTIVTAKNKKNNVIHEEEDEFEDLPELNIEPADSTYYEKEANYANSIGMGPLQRKPLHSDQRPPKATSGKTEQTDKDVVAMEEGADESHVHEVPILREEACGSSQMDDEAYAKQLQEEFDAEAKQQAMAAAKTLVNSRQLQADAKMARQLGELIAHEEAAEADVIISDDDDDEDFTEVPTNKKKKKQTGGTKTGRGGGQAQIDHHRGMDIQPVGYKAGPPLSGNVSTRRSKMPPQMSQLGGPMDPFLLPLSQRRGNPGAHTLADFVPEELQPRGAAVAANQKFKTIAQQQQQLDEDVDGYFFQRDAVAAKPRRGNNAASQSGAGASTSRGGAPTSFGRGKPSRATPGPESPSSSGGVAGRGRGRPTDHEVVQAVSGGGVGTRASGRGGNAKPQVFTVE